jgi:EAL domain-containing protein (putative c-di-GMP-specific phosphodiesterase class I)
VGQWIVKRTVQDCERWRRLGLRPVRAAVNVSAVQFRGREFIDFMLNLVKDWPRDPRGFGIDLEITETALLQDLDGASRQLRELRTAGIRIALDDFGTGYSSLGLLSKLPVDLLKIDRSFISGLPGDHTSVTLTRTIIGLASAFGLLTVAEGVETAEQFELLRTLKCDQSQGYFHCPPLPAQEMDKMLEKDQ